MQGGRGGRHGLFGFGDPFAGFGGFGQPGSLTPGFFGGGNPFDDSFFTNPFGSMMQPSFPIPTPFGSMMQPSFMNPFASMMQPRLLGPSMFGPHSDLNGSMFGSLTGSNQGMSNTSGFIQQAPEPSRPKGPIIKELSSDDEDDAGDDKEDEKKKGNFRKHPRESKEPHVEVPDEVEGTEMFSSNSRKIHSVNKHFLDSANILGIGSKGHSLTRNLNSDGHVNTLQTLHNLNEDELSAFEESWQRNARDNLPGCDPGINVLGNGNVHPDFRDGNQMPALPAPAQSRGINSMGRARHA